MNDSLLLGLVAAGAAALLAVLVWLGLRRSRQAAERRRRTEAAALALAQQEAARAAAQRAAAQQSAAETEARLRAELVARRQAEQQAAAALQAERQQARQAPAPPTAAPVPPSTPAAPTAPALVLLADDSKVVRVKTGRLLTQQGWRVAVAEDGQQAALLLEQETPALLITDVEMPVMDGFELTRYVRQHPRARHIPIIMITSADERLKEEAAAAGVSLVLGKPYAEDVLLAQVALAVAGQPLGV